MKLQGFLVDDCYLDMDKFRKDYPAHWSGFEIVDNEFKDFILKRLEKMGIEVGVCKACGEKILYLPTKSKKLMPTCLDFTSHFANCPKANSFRKK